MTDTHDPGPHLVYRSTRDNDLRTHTLIDRTALTDPRERAICRALSPLTWMGYFLHTSHGTGTETASVWRKPGKAR